MHLSAAPSRSRNRRRARVTKTGRAGMLEFLRKNYPPLYTAVKVKYPEVISGAGLGATEPASDNWASKILDVVQMALPIYQQQQIMSTQLKLAKDGKPLLDVQQISPPGVPIKIELPADVQAEVVKTAAGGRRLMLGAAAGLTGLLAYMIFRRKRRSR